MLELIATVCYVCVCVRVHMCEDDVSDGDENQALQNSEKRLKRNMNFLKRLRFNIYHFYFLIIKENLVFLISKF